MDGENLIRMANRIGAFFASLPDRAEAEQGIAQHIARYWAPRMRRQLFALLDASLAGALQPIVASALLAHREVLLPAGADPLPIPPPGESEA